jgi:hypothetical protein
VNFEAREEGADIWEEGKERGVNFKAREEGADI